MPATSASIAQIEEARTRSLTLRHSIAKVISFAR